MSKRNENEEHGKARHAVDKVQDAVGGLAGRASAATVKSGSELVEKAAVGNMYEIEAAQVALRRSSSPQVRILAMTMIEDHIAAKHHMMAALEMNETRGVEHPSQELDTRHRKMVEHLEAAPADKFDEAYLDQQVLAHQETETLLGGYADKGDNAQLQSVASAILPVVKRHLLQFEALRNERAH